jgi:hypothetical protein
MPTQQCTTPLPLSAALWQHLAQPAADTASAAHEAALEEHYQAAYRAYRARWLAIPGDHGPGRLLPLPRWRALLTEWATAQHTATATGTAISARGQQLARALLLDG